MNKKYDKWTKEFTIKAVSEAMDRSLTIREASQLFYVSSTTLQNKVTDAKFVSARLSTHSLDRCKWTPESIKF